MEYTSLRYFFVFVVSVYVSLCDIKTREVSNWVWVLCFPTGFILVLADIMSGVVTSQALLVSTILSFTLSLVLLYAGFLGGADAKALLFIGLTIPAYPVGFEPTLGDMLAIPVVTVYLNSILLSLVCPLMVLIMNLMDATRGRRLFKGVEVGVLGRLVLLFTARRISLKRLEKDLSYFPAERLMEQNGRFVRKPLYFVKAEEDISKLVAVMKQNESLYVDGLLASPTIPMMVFITGGMILLPIGNIIFWFVSFLF